MNKEGTVEDKAVNDKEVTENENDASEDVTLEEKEQSTDKDKDSNCKSEAEKLKDDIDKQKDAFIRLAAEYENFRKRSVKEKDAIYKNATADAVEALLPVLDSLGFALQAVETAPPEYQKGVEMMKTQFETAFEKLGVSAFGQAGDEFDPNIHNAVSHIDDETVADNVIVEVFQTGYKLGDKIIRHAMVKVAN